MAVESEFLKILSGKDLRKLKNSNKAIQNVFDQRSFDGLFALIFHQERTVVMRAVDAIEKITVEKPGYLKSHRSELLDVLRSARHKELKWHMAQLVTRVELRETELNEVIEVLTNWACDKNESKIVRVNSLQGLFDLALSNPRYERSVLKTIAILERVAVPSLQARIRKLRKQQNTNVEHGVAIRMEKGS